VLRQGHFPVLKTHLIYLIRKENFRTYHPSKKLANAEGDVLYALRASRRPFRDLRADFLVFA